MTDELLAAILANPDDDAPRLVWADREGGERGELVVIQCALAKPLERAERERLQAREKELLEGPLGGSPLMALNVGRAEYRRGFVEYLLAEFRPIERRMDEIFAVCPTLRVLDLRYLAQTVSYFTGPTPAQEWTDTMGRFRKAFANIPAGQIHGLDVSTVVYSEGDWNDLGQSDSFGDAFVETVASMRAFDGLRDLGMMDTGLTRASIRHLATMRLRSLRCANQKLGVDGLRELVAAMPTLRHLAPWSGKPELRGADLRAFVKAPEFAQLETLDLLRSELDAEDRAVLEPYGSRVRLQ